MFPFARPSRPPLPWHPLLALMILLPVLLLAPAPAAAGPAVLVDQIHGHPPTDDLAARWPDCTVTALTAADFPIEEVLSTGVAYLDTTITIAVPAGAAVLYGRFGCSPDLIQYPFISVYGPDGERVCGHFRGHFHVEDPAPGAWEIRYSSWEPELTSWTLGTGPQVLTTDRLAAHDVVLRLYDNTFQLFCGDMPRYTTGDLAVLDAYLAAGGAHYYVRQPEVEFALKPIIDLTAPVDLTCEVRVALPGALTYADPACDEQQQAGGTVATWRGVAVAAGATTRLAYEGALSPPHPLLEVRGGADGAASLTLVSRSAHPLRELHLARHLGGDRWELASAGDLAAGAETASPPAAVLSRDQAAATLAGAIAAGGARGGMSAAQLAEFQGRYRWADRVLAAASGRGQWTALYRVGTAACDALLPLATTPSPSVCSRTLWFWVTGIPAGAAAPVDWPAPDPAPPLADLGPASSPLQVVEYGVIRQRYPTATTGPTITGAVPPVADRAARDQTWQGWTFHDEAWVIDPVHCNLAPELPWLITAGGHPDALDLLDGLLPAGGVRCGAVDAWAPQTILRAGPDAFTDDGVFPPGSQPAVVVGGDVGLGRALGLASLDLFESETATNRELVRRLVGWAAREVSGAADIPPAARIAALSVQPNPFNPRAEVVFRLTAAGPVTVTVHDPAGRRVAELLRHTWRPAGAHRLAWDGRDTGGRPVAAGVYLVRVRAGTGAASCKVTLVD